MIVLKDKIVTEIEIKVTYADLKNELNKIKTRYDIEKHYINYTKHDIIANPNYPFPNKFYFCVPTELIEKALHFANKLNPLYGVIEFTNKRIKHSIKIIKPAKMLHKVDNSINYSHRMADRMCDDLARKYFLLYF